MTETQSFGIVVARLKTKKFRFYLHSDFIRHKQKDIHDKHKDIPDKHKDTHQKQTL